MDAFLIVKIMLSSFGVEGLNIKFDQVSSSIELKFLYLGKERTKKISFQEAEAFFNGKEGASGGPS